MTLLCVVIQFSHHHLLKERKWKLFSQCPALCDPMDSNLPDSCVHGILQARILEWVAVPFSRGSSQPRDQTQVFRIAGRFFTVWAIREFFIAYSWTLCFKLIDQIFMDSLLGSPFLLLYMSVFMLVSYSYEYYNKVWMREHLSFKNCFKFSSACIPLLFLRHNSWAF